jgi:hypothetical protein
MASTESRRPKSPGPHVALSKTSADLATTIEGASTTDAIEFVNSPIRKKTHNGTKRNDGTMVRR